MRNSDGAQEKFFAILSAAKTQNAQIIRIIWQNLGLLRNIFKEGAFVLVMRILAIGDPHGNLKKIRKISLLKGIGLILLTGDLGAANLARKISFENVERKKKGLPELKEDARQQKAMHMEIHNSTIRVLKYLSKYALVYFIEGNVGIATSGEVREKKEKWGIKIPYTMGLISKMKNVHLVKNRLRLIDNLRIGFLDYFIDSSWVRDFKPFDFKKKMAKARKESDKARRILDNFGKIDILVCHQPPYGVLDKVNFKGAPKHWQGKHAGSKVILDYIRKEQPRYVFCGHIHEGEGHKRIGKTDIYNLGVCGYKIISSN